MHKNKNQLEFFQSMYAILSVVTKWKNCQMGHKKFLVFTNVASVSAASTAPPSTAPSADKTTPKGTEAAAPEVVGGTAAGPSDSFGFNQAKAKATPKATVN